MTLNANGLNAPIKRHMVAEWVRKHGPHKYYLQKIYFKTKDLHRLKVKGWKQVFHANGQGKKGRGPIHKTDKIHFTTRTIKRDPEGHFIILKTRIHKEDINIKNIYAPNIEVPKYIRKILEGFKKDIDSNTIIVGDFNTPLSKMDRSYKQNIDKDIVALNNVLDQMDLTNIYREPFIPKKQSTHSFQMHMQHFQR